MTAEAPPSLRSRALGAAVAVVLAVGILAAGYAAIARGRAAPERPQPGDVLLTTRLAVPLSGAAVRLRVRAPGTLEVALDLPAGSACKATWGPPRAPVAGQEDAPDPPKATAWIARAGEAPHREVVYAAGLYVLRIDPEGPPPPGGVGVSVKTVAGR